MIQVLRLEATAYRLFILCGQLGIALESVCGDCTREIVVVLRPRRYGDACAIIEYTWRSDTRGPRRRSGRHGGGQVTQS